VLRRQPARSLRCSSAQRGDVKVILRSGKACDARERSIDLHERQHRAATALSEPAAVLLKGIRAAQKKKGGEAVGAAGVSASAWSPTHPNPTLLVPGLGDAIFTVVEFDVSVLAETSGGGRGALKVWSVGSIEAGGKRSDQHTSRVRFAVQLKIPPGDKAERPPGF
jgi:Trypsin-co-occurring domain 2